MNTYEFYMLCTHVVGYLYYYLYSVMFLLHDNLTDRIVMLALYA